MPNAEATDGISLGREVPVLQSADNRSPRSWVFRIADWASWLISSLFGIASMIFLLAVSANVPIVQLIGFGYLLEVTGRLARQQPYRSAMIGLDKATKIGALVLGSWLLLLPLRLVSEFWLDAYIIEPGSSQERFMRGFQIVLMVLTITHVFAAWICGGKLRYFFWPVIAPFSFAIWIARRFANARLFRTLLDWTLGWLSPNIVNDVCTAQPIGDWFLPAILWKKSLFRGCRRHVRKSPRRVLRFRFEFEPDLLFETWLQRLFRLTTLADRSDFCC